MAGVRKTTLKDPKTGRWTRVCCDCKKTKDLETEFFKATRNPTGKASDWAYQCRLCKVADVQYIETQQRKDPERAPAIRARYARMSRDWRQKNPERQKAARAREHKRLLADPERHIRALENRRIAYRLKAEREGRTVRASKARMADERSPELPAKPLADVLDALCVETGQGIEELASELGFVSRSLRAWRNGERETVHQGVADKILSASGLFWWEVWTEDEYPEVHERLAA